ELPTDRIRRNPPLEMADPESGKHILAEPTEDAADTHIHLEHAQDVVTILEADFEGDVVDADHFAPVDVDNLLVKQITANPQHVLVIMVGGEHFIAEPDTVERNGVTLIVADGEPGRSGADQKAVHAEGVDQWQNSTVPNTPNAALFQVIDR